ncbi:cell division protein SepF [Serpentinicella sp. ANB-PHB4]|uniref:cell division protein SepF n=1 Tax=Serpentinicella sp. ANB-PHB4 TaxID=3074076 RepID=UPI0028627486|nr:cell division protein SepF [Serpentinicella sp. ANB-PHB4]MDR5657922.1 cell division protein SepF [Serpentinicella sp. ANB-PHB4]
MAKIIDKVKYFIGLDVFEDEEEMDDELQEDENYAVVNSKKNKVVNIHTTTQMKVLVYEPAAFEEVTGIVDNLKNRKPVIINLESLDPELAKKSFDFLNGAIYALDGNIQKVSSGIFILAPNNVEIAGNIKEELKNKGVFPWNK